MASDAVSSSDDKSSSRSEGSDKSERASESLSDASKESLSEAASAKEAEAAPEAVTEAERKASQERMQEMERPDRTRVEREMAAPSPARAAMEAGMARAQANPTPAGSYQVAEVAPAVMTDARPAQITQVQQAQPQQVPTQTPVQTPGAPANDNRAPTGQRTTPQAAPRTTSVPNVRGVGLAAAAEALGQAGLQNLNARDIRHLDETYGITLDPSVPAEAEIAMEYTLNRGRSEMTRAITDNVWSGYDSSTMPEAEAVDIVRERVSELEAQRTEAALAAVSETNRTVEDDACAPGHLEGNWEYASRPGMSEAARDYQRQITQTPDLGIGLVEYRVTDPTTGATALFDGCAHWSPERELLEAKHGYGDLLEAGQQYGFEPNAVQQAQEEAFRQRQAAGSTHPVEWHVNDPRALSMFQDAVNVGAGSPNFSVQLTPAQ